MEWTAIYKTLALCLVSILIEAASYTRSGKRWFEQLKQPPYSFSLKIWYVVGAVYYILFGIIGYRLFKGQSSPFSLPLILLFLIMLFNGLGNFIIFKFHSIKWFYLVIYPFAMLLFSFIVVVFPFDRISALLASVYLVWLIYDLYYGYHLWQLNK